MDDAQVQSLMQNWRDALAKQMDEMRVRQWCVEQAIKVCEAGAPGCTDVYEIYDRILKFITAPFAETFKDAQDS
jgi:hypothetical protein